MTDPHIGGCGHELQAVGGARFRSRAVEGQRNKQEVDSLDVTLEINDNQ